MSLLLDALKNAERAKARNSNDQPKPPESKSLRFAAAADEPKSEFADPTELLSNATLELEVSKEQDIIIDAEDTCANIEATVKNTEEINKSEVKLDQISKLELVASRELEALKPVPQAMDFSAAQPLLNDPGADQVGMSRKPEVSEIKVETQSRAPTDIPVHDPLTLEPEIAAQARQILNAPSRLNKNRWLGFSLASVVILFCIGGYFFYLTTALPTPPNLAKLADAGAGIEANEVMNDAVGGHESGSTESGAGMEAVANPTPPLATKSKSPMPTGGKITPSDVSKKTTEEEVADDVQIVSQPIKIKKKRVPQSINKQLKKAYAALQSKHLERAKVHYGNVLQTSQNNVDALLGMGAIASRQRLPRVARDYFNKALQYDPSNVYAKSALSRLTREKNPSESESQLKSLIAENRTSAHLHFDLANLYAAQLRWSDAESAYFNAYNLDKSKPDYAYNLAISLDHLGKKRIARRFYETALHLAQDSPAHFDAPAVRQRLAQIHHI